MTSVHPHPAPEALGLLDDGRARVRVSLDRAQPKAPRGHQPACHPSLDRPIRHLHLDAIDFVHVVVDERNECRLGNKNRRRVPVIHAIHKTHDASPTARVMARWNSVGAATLCQIEIDSIASVSSRHPPRQPPQQGQPGEGPQHKHDRAAHQKFHAMELCA